MPNYRVDCLMESVQSLSFLCRQLNHLRKRKRRPAFSLDAAIEEKRISPKKLVDKGLEPGKNAQVRDEVELVRRVLETLNPKHRVILQMKEEEGLSYEEIAAVLKCSIGTVESRLFRARAKLKEKLEPYLKEVKEDALPKSSKTV